MRQTDDHLPSLQIKVNHLDPPRLAYPQYLRVKFPILHLPIMRISH